MRGHVCQGQVSPGHARPGYTSILIYIYTYIHIYMSISILAQGPTCCAVFSHALALSPPHTMPHVHSQASRTRRLSRAIRRGHVAAAAEIEDMSILDVQNDAMKASPLYYGDSSDDDDDFANKMRSLAYLTFVRRRRPERRLVATRDLVIHPSIRRERRTLHDQQARSLLSITDTTSISSDKAQVCCCHR